MTSDKADMEADKKTDIHKHQLPPGLNFLLET